MHKRTCLCWGHIYWYHYPALGASAQWRHFLVLVDLCNRPIWQKICSSNHKNICSLRNMGGLATWEVWQAHHAHTEGQPHFVLHNIFTSTTPATRKFGLISHFKSFFKSFHHPDRGFLNLHFFSSTLLPVLLFFSVLVHVWLISKLLWSSS